MASLVLRIQRQPDVPRERLGWSRHRIYIEQLGGVPIRKAHFVLSRWNDTAREFDGPALGL